MPQDHGSVLDIIAPQDIPAAQPALDVMQDLLVINVDRCVIWQL
jgi:hypothetical protein